MHLKCSSISHPPGDTPQFSVAHYAGTVTYDIDGFLDKNRDTLAIDLVAVCRLSDNLLIKEIFGGEMGAKKKGPKRGDRKALKKSIKKVKRETDKTNKKTVNDLVLFLS